MRDLTIEDLDALDALHARATPGDRTAIIRGRGASLKTASGIWADCRREDVEATAALHNAWPSVSAMLRRALAPTAAVPGLVFGEPDADGFREARPSPAIAYTIAASDDYPGKWLWNGPGTAFLYVDTESEAIAAANAHNAARLAGHDAPRQDGPKQGA
jgi:hypothetical protein